VMNLGGWSCHGETAGSGRLGSGSQTCEQVRPGSAWSGVSILLVDRLGWLERETLDVQSVGTSGGEARAGDTDGGGEVVVRHLSKTAGVHTLGFDVCTGDGVRVVMIEDRVQSSRSRE
jgi:hypothetical protein